MMDPIIGIDLGTTNSVVAVLQDGRPRVIAEPGTGQKTLPSVVGLDMNGQLLVGTPARNQAILFPDRTIQSVKRHMGEDISLTLGDKAYSPAEVSSLILRTLKSWAEADLGVEVRRAVITVPAFFNESQRAATRLAGQLAGLEVMRIINEPTAAALVYEPSSEKSQRILVYDLGGGTFDVSIVRLESGVVEVLASHGDTHLGGDDFDHLLAEELIRRLNIQDGWDPKQNPVAWSRLVRAAEECKKRLSTATYTQVREEFLREEGTHLDCEIQRSIFEDIIHTMIQKTITCVDRALRDAQATVKDIDLVLLVGGSTRSPIFGKILLDRLGKVASAEIDPDLCVAMGAAVQAGLLSGERVDRILVDITTQSLGVKTLSAPGGDFIFARIIPARTPLPAIRAETFYTLHHGQKRLEIAVYQGESSDVRYNELIGTMMLDELGDDTPAGSPVEIQFTLNTSGILEVTSEHRPSKRSATAIFHRPGVNRYGDVPLEVSHAKLESLAQTNPVLIPRKHGPHTGVKGSVEDVKLRSLRSRVETLAAMTDEDRDLANRLLEKMAVANQSNQVADYEQASAELEDLLYYLQES